MAFKETSNTSIRIDSRLHKVLNYIVLTIIVIAILGPLLILVNMSFKTNQEYMTSGLLQLPKNIFNFDNYRNVLEKGKFLTGFKNTTILCIVPLIGSITMGTMIAFVFGRFQFPFKKVILIAFIGVSLIPQVTTQIAIFTVIRSLGLFNSIFAGIVLYVASNVLQIYVRICNRRRHRPSYFLMNVSGTRSHYQGILHLTSPS